MPDVEAVGEAVSGAAVSRAVEPGHGEADGHTHESACLNCGTPLAGDYCHRCGQKAHVHRTISAWWHDFLHGVLHLDGKFWRTLPMLAWRPGELTRRYIEGERASFVSPMALFLFSVFLMFAVFSATGNKLIGDPGEVQAEIARERSLVASRVDRLETQRRDAAAAGRPTGPIDRELAQARKELDSFEELGEVASSPEPNFSGAPAGAVRYLEEAYARAKKNPSLLFYKLQTNAYKFSWAIIPLSVPFLWLLFLHRRRYRQQFSGYDHFVFITYSIAAMSLALVLFVLARQAGISSDLLTVAFLLVPPVHIYRQLRGAYRLSRWSAAWRTWALLAMAVLVLSLFGLMLLALGVFG